MAGDRVLGLPGRGWLRRHSRLPVIGLAMRRVWVTLLAWRVRCGRERICFLVEPGGVGVPEPAAVLIGGAVSH